MKVFVIAFLAVIGATWADTPAECLFEDFRGTWTFSETARTFDSSVDCDGVLGPVVFEKNFTLEFPNSVVDELGNQGTWTLIYNQGIEVNINERSYFSFSYYEKDGLNSVTSFCDQMFNGWARDRTVRHWSCYNARKTTLVAPRSYSSPVVPKGQFRNNHKLINRINAIPSLSWTAKAYPQFEKYTNEEMFLRAGGPARIARAPRPQTPPASEELKSRVALLPDSFDWRDVKGINYVSPVRDQQSCGSCFTFASMAALEARLRIATNNQRQDIFSPQDAVDCSVLAQGCAGGFAFLIGGRYAQDKGVVAESCTPYLGTDNVCSRDPSCARTYVSEYKYLGEYYGAANEELMLEALVSTGPFPVDFEVYNDFYNYEGGVYFHMEAKNEFNPFELVNHAVLLVGYGTEESTGMNFWTIKNSWGDTWGESGYFRIKRGTNECGVESAPVVMTAIP